MLQWKIVLNIVPNLAHATFCITLFFLWIWSLSELNLLMLAMFFDNNWIKKQVFLLFICKVRFDEMQNIFVWNKTWINWFQCSYQWYFASQLIVNSIFPFCLSIEFSQYFQLDIYDFFIKIYDGFRYFCDDFEFFYEVFLIFFVKFFVFFMTFFVFFVMFFVCFCDDFCNSLWHFS